MGIAIAFAGKDPENRPWRTHYRGPLAIHASGGIDREWLHELQRATRGGQKRPLIDWINIGRRRYGLAAQAEPETSQIVAIAMVVDCKERSPSPWHAAHQWGWVISGVIPIEPIRMMGGLSLWDCRFQYRPYRQAQQARSGR